MSAGAGELALMLTALAAAAAALAAPPRFRLPAAAAALLLAPTLIAVENWDSERFVELRDDPALIIAGGTALAVAIAVLSLAFRRWPTALVLSAVAMLPVRVPVELGGETSHLLLPLYLVIAASVVAMRSELGRYEPRGRWRLVTGALAVVLLLYGIQAAYGPGFSQAAENAGFFFVPFAVLLAVLAAAEWDRRLVAMSLVLVVLEGALFTAVAVGQYGTGELWWNQKVIEGNQYHEWFRVNSLFWDPNIFGRYLAVAITFAAAAVAYATTPRTAWAAMAASVAMLVGLAASFSQSALLSLLAGLAVIVALRWGVRRTALAIAACAAIAIAALAISGTPDLSEERIEVETTGRSALIRGGIELAEDRPFAGYGSGSFKREFRKRFDGSSRIAVSSHSEPITVAAEQGAVGLIPYVALLVIATVAMMAGLRPATAELDRSWSRAAGVAVLAGFAAMIANSIAYAAFLTDPITWALLAVGLALARDEVRPGSPPPVAPAA